MCRMPAISHGPPLGQRTRIAALSGLTAGASARIASTDTGRGGLIGTTGTASPKSIAQHRVVGRAAQDESKVAAFLALEAGEKRGRKNVPQIGVGRERRRRRVVTAEQRLPPLDDLRGQVVWKRVGHRRSLNACVHEFCRKPGMHQRTTNGSIARAAAATPMSSGSHPNCSSTFRTSAFAAASSPQ